jgi:hypothetical protein
MTRSRSVSRRRDPSLTQQRVRRDGNKDMTMGSVAKNYLPPSGIPSLGAFVTRERSISISRQRKPEERSAPDTIDSSRGRSRSSSRVRSAIKGVRNVFTGRGSSRPKLPPSYDTTPTHTRGRSMIRREAPERSEQSDISTEVKPVVEPEPEPEPEPVKVNKIDTLIDHHVMRLDDKNTVMHAACLLHHSSEDIIDRLGEDPSLAFELNGADELPLHYAVMDKKGVNHDVLKKLLRINPEGVRQRNIQNSLPVHLACMVGVPSQYALKTLLKMYPKSVMIQSDFPLLFERDMLEPLDRDKNNMNVNVEDDESNSGIIAYKPPQVTKTSGIASFFACAAPSQAELELAYEAEKRRQEVNAKYPQNNDVEEGPQVETGFTPLHLAVMNRAKPAAIQLIVETNPKCVPLKSSKERTALDCAQYIIRQHWLYGSDDEGTVENTFAAIEILENVSKNE